MNKLPCRHILAVRKHSAEPLIDNELVMDRWSRKYFVEHHPRFNDTVQVSTTGIVLEHNEVPPPPVISAHQKFKVARDAAQSLATVLSTLPLPLFKTYIKEVKAMQQLAANLKECVVVEYGTCAILLTVPLMLTKFIVWCQVIP
jgi:hypothetical protein